MFTDNVQVNTGVTFDNQFIVDVPDDEAVAERFHGITENVAAYSLDYILNELRTVGFYAFPLLCRANSFIGDGFSAEMIGTDSGIHICKPTSGWELDEEHSAFVK